MFDHERPGGPAARSVLHGVNMGVNVMFHLNPSPVTFASFLLLAVIVSTPSNAQTYQPLPAKEGHEYAETYCSNRGHHVEMGGLSCLRVDGRVFLARCEMSLNSPVWRMVQNNCPAELDTLADKSAATSSSAEPGAN